MKKVYKKMTYSDRQKIEKLLAKGVKPSEIAKEIDVCYQTIYRELKRGRGEDGVYKAEKAQKALFS